jgi:hypothetical protein
MEKIALYVKSTSNSEGMPLTMFQPLGPEWVGDELSLYFGEDEDRRQFPVVGWTDLFFGTPTRVHVVKVEHQGAVGFLVYGGNSGVRILSDEAHAVAGVNDHLPPGWGMPIIWVEDAADLPDEVRAVVDEPEIGLEQAADEFGLAYSTLAQAAREGRVRARREEGQWRVTRTAMSEAVENGRLRPQRGE